MTTVLAVSGSLRSGESDTTRILAPFLEGVRGEGASVKLVYVKDCRIEPCRGVFHDFHGRALQGAALKERQVGEGVG